MAGIIPLATLFLNKFVEVNLVRYKDDPEMLPLFQNLGLNDIVISDLIPGVAEPQVATVSSDSRNFRGILQRWLPAFLDKPEPFALKNPVTPLASINDLLEQADPGVYGYLSDGEVFPGMVLPKDTLSTTLEANAKALFQSNFGYAINDEELTVNENSLSVTMNVYTRGSIPFVVAKGGVMVIPPTNYRRLAHPEDKYPYPVP